MSEDTLNKKKSPTKTQDIRVKQKKSPTKTQDIRVKQKKTKSATKVVVDKKSLSSEKNTDVVVVEESKLPLLIDTEVYKGKKMTDVLEDYFKELTEYEKLLLGQIDEIEIASEEDFVVKSQIFNSLIKEVNVNHKNKKEFIQSLLDYQIKKNQLSAGVDNDSKNPLNSVQNFMIFINNLQDQKVEKKITDVIISETEDDKMKKFIEDSEDYNPTKVFLDETQTDKK